jgi:hypothetical protein
MALLNATRGSHRGLLLVAAALIAACSAAPAATTPGPAGVPSSGNAPSSPAGASPGQVATDEAAGRLRSVSLGDPATLAALEQIRFSPAGADAAATILASGASGDLLWAATWVYASSGSDPGVLGPLLANADPSIRAIAAAGLVGRGDQRGFEPLVALLGESGVLAGSAPPSLLWEFAGDVLERYTGAGLGPTLTASDAERVSAAQAWREWLGSNGPRLAFDTTTHRWSAR